MDILPVKDKHGYFILFYDVSSLLTLHHYLVVSLQLRVASLVEKLQTLSRMKQL